MEYLAMVRDGSDGGAIVNGYWSTQVIAAELNSNELIPLYQDLYSQNAPDFISENADNCSCPYQETILKEKSSK